MERSWIFQTIDPNRITTLEVGRIDRWCVRRYRNHMRRQDLVFIWLGGSASVRGIHGWGMIASDPSIGSAENSYHVDVQYKQPLTPFIPATVLREHPVLARLTILHMPRATNFRVSHEEAVAIMEMIRSQRQA